jgi:nitroreductase
MLTDLSAWQASDSGVGPALAACLEAAGRAPSIHNSQPWRFRVNQPGTIEVYVDGSRRMRVIDPLGREALLSIGAALMNMRIAILAHGWTPSTVLLPDPDRPTFMAKVSLSVRRRPDATVQSLAAAIPRRHTNRRPFRAVTIPEAVVDDLVAAAAAEGGQLVMTDAVERDAVISLVRTANDWQRHDPRYRAELHHWTAGAVDRPDGVPPFAFGPWDFMETLPVRDFGIAHPLLPRREAKFETDPAIAVLYSHGDSRRDWLRAGEALQRVLLTATVRGLSAGMMSSAIEHPHLRELLTTPEDSRAAQMILRFGYGETVPATPRLPLSSLMLPPAETASPDQDLT